MLVRLRRRQVRMLGILLGLGGVYSAWLKFHLPLTGSRHLDGILGVMLGLFTCAYLAGNVLDLILYKSLDPSPAFSKNANRVFWAFNVLTLLVGWFDIVNGLLRYSGA